MELSRSSHKLWPLIFVFPLSGCENGLGLFAPAGPVAQAQQSHLLTIVWLMLIVILPVFAGVAFVLWRYRLGSDADYRPEWEFSWLAEIVIWGVPAVLVGVLGWNLWKESHNLDPYAPLPGGPPLEVRVVGYDWKWLFIYPEQGVALANRLILPVDRPVRFRLTSATVLQSFMIPQLGGQIYAMPKMVTELNLKADALGRYRGQNTQFNGEGFAEQKFVAEVVEGEQFEPMLAELTADAPALDDSALSRLKKREVLNEPLVFGRIMADPFVAAAGKAATGPDGVAHE